MSHCVHTHTHKTTDRTTHLLISSSVHYVHLGGDNKFQLCLQFHITTSTFSAKKVTKNTKLKHLRDPVHSFTPSLSVNDYLRKSSFPSTDVRRALGYFFGVGALYIKFTLCLVPYLQNQNKYNFINYTWPRVYL